MFGWLGTAWGSISAGCSAVSMLITGKMISSSSEKTENSCKCQAVSQNPSQDCVWKLQTCVCKEGGCFPIHCSHQKKHDITYLPLFGYVPWTGPGLYWQHGGLGWTWLNLFFLDSVVLCDVDGWRGIVAFCYGTVYKSLNAWCFHQCTCNEYAYRKL